MASSARISGEARRRGGSTFRDSFPPHKCSADRFEYGRSLFLALSGPVDEIKCHCSGLQPVPTIVNRPNAVGLRKLIARTLGANEWRVFGTISLPLALRGIVAGAVLAFARAMGEFGATAIVAGMIPRKTMTISLSIYQHIQLGQDAAALPLLFISIGIVFVTVLCGQIISRKRPR